MAYVGERKTLLCAQSLLALELQTLVGNVACLLLCVQNMERIACCRRAVKTEDYCRLSRSGTLYAAVALVEHCPDASVVGSRDDIVAHLQRTV